MSTKDINVTWEGKVANGGEEEKMDGEKEEERKERKRRKRKERKRRKRSQIVRGLWHVVLLQ